MLRLAGAQSGYITLILVRRSRVEKPPFRSETRNASDLLFIFAAPEVSVFKSYSSVPQQKSPGLKFYSLDLKVKYQFQASVPPSPIRCRTFGRFQE